MKKALHIMLSILIIIAAAVFMWKVLFPFIGWTISGIFGGMTFSPETVAGFFKDLLGV